MAAGRGIGVAHVDIEADTTGFASEVARAARRAGERAKEIINDALGEIGGPKLRAAVARVRQTIERGLDDIEVQPELDETQLRADVKRLNAYLAANGLDLNIDPDFESTYEELEALRARLAATALSLNIDADVGFTPGELKAFVEATQARLRAADVELPVDIDVDEPQIQRALARVNKRFEQGGSDAADSFARGMSLRTKAIVGAVLLLMEPAAVALEGLSAALTSVVSSAVFALGSAAGAATPLLFGFGGALTGVIIGMQGMGDAMSAIAEEDAEKFNEALKELSPSAAAFATEMQGLWGSFKEMRSILQERLFAGLADNFKEMATVLIPELTTGLGEMVDEVNEFAGQFMDMLAGVDFGGILEGLAPAIGRMLDGFLALAEGFFKFIEAATPAAARLSALFKSWALGVADFDGEKVAKFLDRGLDSLVLWGRLAGEIADAFGTIFAAGAESGDNFVVKLTNIMERFNEFLDSAKGQNALEQFFKTGERVIAALAPVIEGLAVGIHNMVTEDSIARFEELATTIGEILPILGQLFEVVGDARILNTLAEAILAIGQALVPIMPVLSQFAETLGDALGDVVKALGPSLKIVALALGRLLTAAEPLIEVLGEGLVLAIETLAPLILQLVDAVVELMPSFIQIIDAVMPLIPLLGDLLGGAIEILLNLLRPLLPVLATLVSTLVDALAPILPPLIEAFVSLSEALAPVVEELGAHLVETIESLVPLLPPLAELFIALVEAIIPLLPIITDLLLVTNRLTTLGLQTMMPVLVEVIGWLTRLAEILGTVIKAVVGFVEDVIGWFQKLYDTLVGNSIIPDLINGITEWFNKLFDLIELVADVFQGIYDVVSDLLGNARDLIEGLLGDIEGAFDTAWGAIERATSTAWNLIKDYIIQPLTDAWSAVVGLGDDIEGALDTAWAAIETATSTAWDLIKDYIIDPIQSAYDTLSGIVDSIESALSFSGLASTVRGAMNSVKDAIIDPIRSAYDTVRGIVDNIKNKISSIPGSGIVGGAIDKLTAGGGIFLGAQQRIIGEAGREAVIPLDRPIATVDPSVRGMAEILRGIKPGGGMTNYWTINESGDAEATAHKVINRLLIQAA